MVHFIPPDIRKATSSFVDLTWNFQRSATIFLQSETPFVLAFFTSGRASTYLRLHK